MGIPTAKTHLYPIVNAASFGSDRYYHARISGTIYYTRQPIPQAEIPWVGMSGGVTQLCAVNLHSGEQAQDYREKFLLELARHQIAVTVGK